MTVITQPVVVKSLNVKSLSKMETDLAKPSARIIKTAELARCKGVDFSATGTLSNADSRQWTCINGKVYDVSNFISQHPGGQVIELCLGRDSTALIESYHSRSSLQIVKKYIDSHCTYVGNIESTLNTMRKTDQFSEANDFYAVLSERVASHIAKSGLKRDSYESLAIFETVLTTILFVAATIGTCFYGSIIASVLLGVLTGRMGFLMHTGNHCASSRRVWVNDLIGFIMDFIGANSLVWQYEHQVAHHTEPNTLGVDNDCQIGAPVIKMHPDLPFHSLQPYQHILVPIAMSIGFIKWFITDFLHLMRGYVGNVTFAVREKHIITLLVSKTVFAAVRIVAPLVLFDLQHALILIMIPLVIGAHYLENIFIVNHIQSELVPPPNIHWAEKQCFGTCNWASGSVLMNFMSGGLNHQIEHHLFPSLSIYHYPSISPIVQQTCKEFQIPYKNFNSYVEAYINCLTYLRDIGQKYAKQS